MVKRDDLFGQYPAPPLGKLRGLLVVLDQLHHDGVRLIGCWDTRISRLSQGVAVLAHQYPGLKCIVSYPTKVGQPLPEAIRIASAFAAEIHPVRGNFPSIAFAQAKRYVEARGGRMLPFGLECLEAVNAISKEARTVPVSSCRNGTIVLSCGSGVTLAGIIKGLPANPSRIVALSSGRSVDRIRRTVERYVGPMPKYVDILPARMPYDRQPNIACPFPTHPNYDLKAWALLKEELSCLDEPILFWNIGA